MKRNIKNKNKRRIHPKKYQNNKYFKIVVIIIIINVIGISYFVYNYFAQQKKIETQLENQKRKQNANVSVDEVKKLKELNTFEKQVAYLDSIKSGDVIKINQTKITYPIINQNVKIENKLPKTKVVPKIDLSDNVSEELLPTIVANNVDNIEIDPPKVINNELALKWSDNEEVNKQAQNFLNNYVKIGNKEITLNLDWKKNSILTLNIPNIYKIKYIAMLMKKYEIVNLKVNLPQNSSSNELNNNLDMLEVLQDYANLKKIKINFDFVLQNIINSDSLSNDNNIIIDQVLKKKINVNTFILDINSPYKQYLENRINMMKSNITSLKYKLQKSFKKYQNIEFNDGTYNSFIGISLHTPSDNVVYKASDFYNILDLYKQYSFQSIYLDNLNVDSGISWFNKSEYRRNFYIETLSSISSNELIQRDEYYKVLQISNKNKINYLMLTKSNPIQIEDFKINNIYKINDVIKYNNKVYKCNVESSVNITPGINDFYNNWKYITTYDKYLKTQENLNIQIIKHID